MENIKKVENEEIEVTEEVTEESKGKQLMSKIGAGLKKNGKKVATIAAIGAMTAVGYMIGHKTASCDSEDLGQYDDDDVIDVTDESKEVTE